MKFNRKFDPDNTWKRGVARHITTGCPKTEGAAGPPGGIVPEGIMPEGIMPGGTQRLLLLHDGARTVGEHFGFDTDEWRRSGEAVVRHVTDLQPVDAAVAA